MIYLRDERCGFGAKSQSRGLAGALNAAKLRRIKSSAQPHIAGYGQNHASQ
jgi:hypothetical protein